MSVVVAISESGSESSSLYFYTDSDNVEDKNHDNNGNNGDGKSDIDSMEVEIGSDGVIDLQADSNDNSLQSGSFNRLNINQSLRIDNTNGDFHLGPQWQSTGADIARMNAGPEFGQASTWTMNHEPQGGHRGTTMDEGKIQRRQPVLLWHR